MSAQRMLFFAFVAFSTGYFLLGLLSRQASLRANPCGMTFTMRDRQDVRVASSSSGGSGNSSFRLIKYSLPKSQKLLNAYPVLFVPGHMGDADQARSLASYMHNGDNFFQYFSLDFGRSLSGVHGAYVIQQAVFLNDALQAIRDLYRKKASREGKRDDWDDHFLKVIIVGHSLGGLVARTALLLDNHPRGCLVSDIVMLSSPNVAAPYGPDSSLELLYKTVNRDWSDSFLRTGDAKCHAARRPRGRGSGGNNASTSWASCSNCTANTRLISITGGDIDILVDPMLTRLDVITPSPRNLTHEARTGGARKDSGLVLTLKNAIYGVLHLVSPHAIITEGIRSVHAAAQYLRLAAQSPSSNTTEGAASSSTDASEIFAEPLSAADIEPAIERERAIRNSSYRAYENITAELWGQHMQQYLEPQHLALRASQLVGHPVDHLSILWCKEFLSILTKAMRVLAVNPAGGLDVVTTLFTELRSPAVPSPALKVVREELLAQLYDHLKRGESAANWAAAAAMDREHLAGAGAMGALRASAALFVSLQLYRVVVCYAALSALLLTTPLLRRLAGHPADTCLMDEWQLLSPRAHLHLDILLPKLQSLVHAVVPEELRGYLLSYRCLAVVLVPVLSKLWWEMAAAPRQSLPFGPYDNTVLWLIAYGVAVTARAVILALLYTSRGATRLLLGAVKGVLRATLWCRPVRRRARKTLRAMPSALRRLWFYRLHLTCIALVSGSLFATRGRLLGTSSSLPLDVYFTSVISLSLTVLATLLLLLDLLVPPEGAEAYHGGTQMLMFYLPLPLLCLPSALYAAQLLSADSSGGLTATLDVAGDLFGPERANFCFCLLVVVAQLLSARSDHYHSTADVEEITWLAEILGPDEQQQQQLRPPSSGGGSSCTHEDGGSSAVYEEIEDSGLGPGAGGARVVTAGVVLGPTYRVVHCGCATDRSLAGPTEWCAWCSCRRCGGAHLLPASGRAGVGAQRDFSAVLGLVVGLHVIAALSYYYAKGAAYKYLHLHGLAAILFLARDFFAGRKGI